MLTTIVSLLRALAGASRNPNLDLDAEIGQILDYVSDLIEIGDDARAKLEALEIKVRAWVAEDRNPTDEEITEMRADAEAALSRLAAARAARESV